ncbi:hypothetical protein VNO80_13236 [Phaseolus coccineus]|uniref:Uncharacterized protein n=1 Tax=Phaseolus coccineus TaxID=3886 RepID=A0AAN9N5U2_PHACN
MELDEVLRGEEVALGIPGPAVVGAKHTHRIAATKIAALAIRSGNGLLLKEGKEAKRSNAILNKATGSLDDGNSANEVKEIDFSHN